MSQHGATHGETLEPYVVPVVTDLGSVAALTQAQLRLGNADGGMATSMNMS